jgi:predicted lipid carrier protein YhbT
MTTLQDALGADPSSPWIPAMVKDIEGKWYCSMTKEDIEIYWRINAKYTNEYSTGDFWDFLAMVDRMVEV